MYILKKCKKYVSWIKSTMYFIACGFLHFCQCLPRVWAPYNSLIICSPLPLSYLGNDIVILSSIGIVTLKQMFSFLIYGPNPSHKNTNVLYFIQVRFLKNFSILQHASQICTKTCIILSVQYGSPSSPPLQPCSTKSKVKTSENKK